jgi:hypothetical protein
MMDTVAWGWPVLEVNANQTVDRAEPLAFVRSSLAKRHLRMYGQELTDAGRRVNASHRRQIPLGLGRVPGRPRR